MENLLEVQALGKDFHHPIGFFRKQIVTALNNISFTLKPGETLAIMGESGSGKSTLARILAGAERHSRGQIMLNNSPLVYGKTKRWARHIRLIFQDSATALNPALTIGKILDEPLRLNTQLQPDARQAKIRETLKKVGLMSEHLGYYPHMFSGGQKQRIALARAIILDPRIVILDEALAALDPSVRAQIINLLLQLQQDMGLSYILNSHDLHLIQHLSDRVIVIREGNIIEQGETGKLFRQPQKTYTKRMLMLNK